MEELIKGCIAGNRTAQQALYNRSCKTLFNICLRYCGSREGAEDALQLAYLKIFNNMAAYNYTGSFEGWMKRITINTAIELWRKESRVPVMVNSDEYAADLAAPAALPDIESKELLAMVQRLPAKLRLVFNMYAIEGYSHKEIAAAMEINEGASKTLLHRARTALKNSIIKQYL